MVVGLIAEDESIYKKERGMFNVYFPNSPEIFSTRLHRNIKCGFFWLKEGTPVTIFSPTIYLGSDVTIEPPPPTLLINWSSPTNDHHEHWRLNEFAPWW